MKKRSKTYRKSLSLLPDGKPVAPSEAVSLLKQFCRQNESVDVAIRLNVDTRKQDQNIRGTIVLPKGIGKTQRVLVFAKGEKIKEAEDAGADFVGGVELIQKVEGGWLDFDVAIAAPDMMKDVSKLGKLLGPRGLMPNAKTGTVTFDIANTVKEYKAGRVEYRAEKAGIVHSTIGKGNFSEPDLLENLNALMSVLVRAKPASVKGQYIKSVYISSTFSPSVRIDHSVYL